MPGFTVAGVVLAVVGTFLMMPEIFKGYAGIFANVEQQAERRVWVEDQRFFGITDEQAKERKKQYQTEIKRWKLLRTIGFILLIIGISLQMIGLSD